MLLKFFLTCNKIGAFTLGGGYAMIPIMERDEQGGIHGHYGGGSGYSGYLCH